jgi:hypothetical protein
MPRAGGDSAAPIPVATAPPFAQRMLSDLRLAARGNAAVHQAALLNMQQSYGNRAVQRYVRRAAGAAPAPMPLQRQPAPGERSTPAPARPAGGWNAGEVKLGPIRRIHLTGLSEANKNSDLTDTAGYDDGDKQVKDFTKEDATGQAVVLVPDPLDAKLKEVDVLLYLHGFGIGYRERSAARTECAQVKKVKGKNVCVAVKDVAGMGAGTVRDVAVDRMDEQLASIIKSRGQPMVAVMPQGAYTTAAGPNFGKDFNSDKYINEVFSKVGALSGKTAGRVVLAGHSGAGNTIGPRLEQAVVDKGKHSGELKTDAQIKKEGGLRLPARLAEVVLFDSINGSGQRDEVETWLRAQIKKDAQELKDKTPDEQCAYLQGPDSMRFRAYHSTEAKGKEGYYTKQYDILKTNIPIIIKEELAAAKVKLDPAILDLLRANYLNDNQQVPVTHEYVMGTGKVEEALGALPKGTPPTACPPAPSPAPAPPDKAPTDVQKRAAPDAKAVQRQPAPGAQVGAPVVQRDPTKPAAPADKSLGEQIVDAATSAVKAVLALGAISITFGPHAVQSAVSDHSIGVLKGILYTAGLTSATITSTARTANDQARAMFDNLQAKGVAHQKALYGPAGDAVIDVYVAAKAAGKTAAGIKADMEAKIIEIGPANVSRHCADPTKLNVFDVAPSSISNHRAFEKAAQAAVGTSVSNFIPYPQDPGYHFEIVPQ